MTLYDRKLVNLELLSVTLKSAQTYFLITASLVD